MRLRAILLALRALSFIVPSGRRAGWLDQWRGELWHYTLWLDRQRQDAAALRLAGRAFGAIPHAIQLRLLSWSPAMLLQDIRFAWRMFVRRPGFTAIAVLILALGIGANTTIFIWMQTAVLSPLDGVERQDRLLAVRGATSERDNLSISYPNFTDLLAAKPDGVSDLVAFRLLPFNLRVDGDPIRVFGELVSPNFFEFFGVRPSPGRGFHASEGAVPDRDAVAVISHDLWRRAFNADQAIAGRSVLLNGRAFTIVGVAPPGFHGSVGAVVLDLYVPLTMQKAVLAGDRLPHRGNGWLSVYARLTDGVAPSRAQAGITAAGARLAAQYPDVNGGRELRAIPLWRDGVSGLLLPILATMMAMVAVVLLIASANIAGLLLASAAARQRETAVRLAVGASRWQVVRQMLVETLMLAAAGCMAGLVVARWGAELLQVFIPRTPFPLRFQAGIDLTSFAYATAVAVVTAIVAGVVPAIRASRVHADLTLRSAASTPARAGQRFRQVLVAGQIGLSVVLLVCAALFTRSLTHAGAIDPGYALRQGLLASIDLMPAGYDDARGAAFIERMLERVSALPHVAGATVARTMPMDVGGSSDMIVTIDGYTPPPGQDVMSYYNQVGPGYFETMGIPIVRGRGIGPDDRAARPNVAVINETMARRYWPDGDPIGATIRYGSGPVTIVGVARDGKYSRLGETPRNYTYLPALQNYRPDVLLHVATGVDPSAVLPAIRAAVRDLDPNLPLFDVRTIEDHMRISTFVPRMIASVLAVFGALGLLLAAVGLYGVIAFTAAQRTREIGLRMALGADRGQVVRLVLRDGVVLVGIGLVVGLALALAAGRLIAQQLIGVSAIDPVSFAGTIAVLGVIAAAACVIPARRASSLNPLTALRHD